MKLVPNAGNALQWWSIRFAGLALAAEAAWMAIPPEALETFLTTEQQRLVTSALIIAAIIGRVIDQGGAGPQE